MFKAFILKGEVEMGRVISVPAKVEAHVDSFKEHFKLHEDSTVLGEKNDEYSKFSPFPPL